MIGETIRTEFEALKNDFETIRQQIEDDVVRTELYKGEFYELTPYSYQRNGCKQGKPVKRPDTIKSTKNVNSTEEFALEKNKRNAGIVGSGRNGIIQKGIL